MSNTVFVVMSDNPEEIGVYTDHEKAKDAKSLIVGRAAKVVGVEVELDKPPRYVGTIRSTL